MLCRGPDVLTCIGSFLYWNVVKILDKPPRPFHTLATLVRNSHWGVARALILFEGQSLAPSPCFLGILLDTCQVFFYTETSSSAPHLIYPPTAHLYLLCPGPDSSFSQGFFIGFPHQLCTIFTGLQQFRQACHI